MSTTICCHVILKHDYGDMQAVTITSLKITVCGDMDLRAKLSANNSLDLIMKVTQTHQVFITCKRAYE